MNLERLEWLLGNWADYMRRDDNHLGYPKRSLMIASGGGASIDAFEIMCDEVDISCAEQIDALIDSLPPNQQCAINHKWLSAVYRMRDLDGAYIMAIDNLIVMADRRGIV